MVDRKTALAWRDATWAEEEIKDYLEVAKWCAGNAMELGEVREYLEEVAETMTPEQIAEAQRLAHEWLKSHSADKVD